MALEQRIEKLTTTVYNRLFFDLAEYGIRQDGEKASAELFDFRLASDFLPLFNVRNGKVLGHEALLRPFIGDKLVSPRVAFAVAEERGSLVKFDRACRIVHMLNYISATPEDGLLFLNVHPRLLVSVNSHGKMFEMVLHHCSVPSHRVVIEILGSAIEDESLLFEAVKNYRDRGYKVAMDDYGTRHSSLERLWRLAPDFVKLDSTWLRSATHSDKVQRILPKLVSILHDAGATVVAEGVESDRQLELALTAGADLVQGHYFGRPDADPNWQVSDEDRLETFTLLRQRCHA